MKAKTFPRILIASMILAMVSISQALANINNLIDPLGQDRATKNVAPRVAEAVFRGGLHLDGGGVFIGGTFSFFLVDGEESAEVAVADLALVRMANGGLAVVHDEVEYEVDFHTGVECPMAQFIERGGDLLFSVPPVKDDQRLSGLGMVPLDQDPESNSYIAREFGKPYTVEFWPLVKRMDFFDPQIVWVPNPKRLDSPSAGDFGGMFARYANKLMSKVENDTLSSKIKSYFNVMESDFLNAYLVSEESTLELSSTPIRVSWSQGPSGTAITRISILPYSSLVDEPLWEPNDGYSAVSQLDVLTMYNFASILRTFFVDDPARFADTQAMLCQ